MAALIRAPYFLTAHWAAMWRRQQQHLVSLSLMLAKTKISLAHIFNLTFPAFFGCGGGVVYNKIFMLNQT